MSRAHIGLAVVILVEILLLFIGCQSGGVNPLTPESGNTGPDVTLSESSAGIDGTQSTGSVAPTPALWGFYEVTYNSVERQIESVPIRGPAFAFNVVNFLQPPLGSISGMTIGVLDDSEFMTQGLLDIRVILHHPFPGQSVYTGFDVCGIFITEGSIASDYNSSLTHADPGTDPTLLNPDGYTRWMNPTEFLSGDVMGYEPGFWGTSESSENSGFVAGATLNPYKYFAQLLGPGDNLHDWVNNPANLSNRGMFPAGASCSRDYNLLFPIVDDHIVFLFNYAVLANWVVPVINPPVDPLTDFPLEANAGWPLHLWVSDNSNAYYTDDESGGTLSFDLEIFDWGAFKSPAGVPGEVSRFVVWSDQPLIEGGWAEVLSTEVEWNSGFTASTSVVTIELDAAPSFAGDVPVWIEVQSTNPSSYDQNFGAIVPSDPLAGYVSFPVEVLSCPKASVDGIEADQAGSGEYLNDIIITGENFVNGADLGFWLEAIDAGDSAGAADPFKVYATDIVYIDANTVRVDFDLQNAPYGDYSIGCINGCGLITTPEENFGINPLSPLKLKMEKPGNLQLSTNRTGPAPGTLDTLTISWTPISNAYYYRIYGKIFDVSGNMIGAGALIGTVSSPQYTINLLGMPNGASGALELWVTALPGQGPNDADYESIGSLHALALMQNFEGGLGAWQTRAENTYYWRFIRSTVDCAYSGTWGLKAYGYPLGYSWILFTSPPIHDVIGANNVHVEFLHRHIDVDEINGYQVGWLYNLPLNGHPDVTGYYPISTVAYGYPYNDTDSLALQTKFGCNQYNDNNWQAIAPEWNGWWLSGLDASEILGDGLPNYISIAGAANDETYIGISIDEVAILIY